MKLNWDAQKMRQLFREMALDDARRAPKFAGVLEAAVSNTARRRDRVLALKLALAAATLILVVFAAIAIFQHREPITSERPAQQALVDPEPTAPNGVSEQGEPAPSAPRHRIRHIRRRAPVTEPAIDMKSLFAWQSPTASLLKLSREDLLMSLPRVGESLQTIKKFSPDLWN